VAAAGKIMGREVRGDEKQLHEKEHEENYQPVLTFLAGKRKQVNYCPAELNIPKR